MASHEALGVLFGAPAPNTCHHLICYQILLEKMMSHFVLDQSMSKLKHVKNIENPFF